MSKRIRAVYCLELVVPKGLDPSVFATEMGKTIFEGYFDHNNPWWLDDVIDMSIIPQEGASVEHIKSRKRESSQTASLA